MQKADQFFARLMLVTHSFFLCKWGKVLEMAGFVLPTLGLYVHSSPRNHFVGQNSPILLNIVCALPLRRRCPAVYRLGAVRLV